MAKIKLRFERKDKSTFQLTVRDKREATAVTRAAKAGGVVKVKKIK